jgi:hypothetical protein
LKRIAQSIARRLGVTGVAELNSFLEVELHFTDAARVDQLKTPGVEPVQSEPAATLRGPSATVP